MQFLAPWMLLGGAAVSVPIALHFFFKSRYKPLPWAAMKFLKEAIELSGLSTDFLPGITAGLAAALSGTAPVKEIYLFTDLQKLGFERQQGAIRAKCEEIRDRANLIFVRCGNPERKVANVAVTDVALIGDIPHTRTRVPFVITLKNTGTVPVKGVSVGLELEGKVVEKDSV